MRVDLGSGCSDVDRSVAFVVTVNRYEGISKAGELRAEAIRSPLELVDPVRKRKETISHERYRNG